MNHDDKTEAQSKLAAACEAAGVFPGHVYTHCQAAGEYVVFTITLDEVTLEPLVHYYSLTYGSLLQSDVSDAVDADARGRVSSVRVRAAGNARGVLGCDRRAVDRGPWRQP
jgi:hypothetical protein